MAQGEGTLTAKIDITSAYRLVSAHPADRPLLGIKWEGKVYVDTKLPFGLCSAPKIFNALADNALEWCFQRDGVTKVEHYLDDFITMGALLTVCFELREDKGDSSQARNTTGSGGGGPLHNHYFSWHPNRYSERFIIVTSRKGTENSPLIEILG